MYYAVKVGRVPGVYEDWASCSRQVTGFKGAIFKKFTNYEQAVNFAGVPSKPLQPHPIDTVDLSDEDLCKIYVDGSYSDEDRVYKYGYVILCPRTKKEIKGCGAGYNVNYINTRNVAGEICGTVRGIKHALELGYKDIEIYHDFQGIASWAKGEWKPKSPIAIDYVKFIDSLEDKGVNITFIKVKAHTGDYYNELADTLASQGGIK